MADRVGFIGLGAMGRPMAGNLLEAGFPLVVHSRSPAPVDATVGRGAERGTSPADVAARSDVVITMLPDTPDVEQVVAGRDGVFAGVRPGMLIIDMSTISPLAVRKLAREAEAHGCDFLDAPVSGGDIGARNAMLSIMVGGKEAAFNRAMPIFQAMGKTILLIGDSGAGQITKAANQILTSIHIEAVAEALVFAAKAGVDPVKVRQALMGGAAYSRILEFHGQRMIERNFKPGFRMRLHRKDLDITVEAGRAYGAALPVTAQVRELMTETINDGQGDMDNSSFVLLLEKLSNLQGKGS
jgi:2-hydroxy-3-oxopropionate reductase